MNARLTLAEPLPSPSGFTLLEMAIVLLIVGLLLGGLVMPLSSKIDQQRRQTTEQQLADVRAALIGYAIANDALPCPATPGSNGAAASTATGCTTQYGFVPAVTLGLFGSRNDDGLLIDAWGNPLRYAVSRSDANGNANWDFVRPGEMRAVTIAALTPDLAVCNTAAGSSATACASAATTITANTPVVIYSMGKDWTTLTSTDEQENTGATAAGGPSARNYPVANDRVFVNRAISASAGTSFDDIVTWVSPNTLYGQLVAAGRLP